MKFPKKPKNSFTIFAFEFNKDCERIYVYCQKVKIKVNDLDKFGNVCEVTKIVNFVSIKFLDVELIKFQFTKMITTTRAWSWVQEYKEQILDLINIKYKSENSKN
jgi:uncharacterized protein YlbG (UPF0298 family)